MTPHKDILLLRAHGARSVCVSPTARRASASPPSPRRILTASFPVLLSASYCARNSSLDTPHSQ